ncbi:Lipoprotein LipO [Geodia barretti]|uniref:Lipoprotein LipO n=1 Tax=Geodia barretti TaxID=519541 RepID=A0AA35RYS2_GEOBA|nr:Lipoprotein LipO [Geodia barretti]
MVVAMAATGAFGHGTEEAAAPDELPTLHVATHTGWAALIGTGQQRSPVYQELERLSGVHIEWENIQVANYAEVMRARLAAAVNLPDVINMSLLGDIGQHGRDGLIIPLNDLLEEYAPNINSGAVVEPAVAGRGRHLEMPETQADMMTALRLFRDSDPNGNGENDEILIVPAAGRGYLRYLGNLYGFEYSIVSEYLVDDGQVSWIFQSPRMKEYLTWLNELYTEGLLDKAYATDSWTETLEKVTNDRVGLITCWTTFARIYSGAHPAGKPDGSIPMFENGPPIEGPYGDKFFVKREIYGGDQMGITKDAKQPEVAMHWIDFIRNSEEALMLQNFGIVGTATGW